MKHPAAILILGMLILDSLPGCASHRGESPISDTIVLMPEPVPIASFTVEGKEYHFERDGVVIVVAHLDESGVHAYYAGRGTANPLDTLYPILRPTLFLARIENHTRKNIYFNPSMSGIVDSNGKPYVNRDLTDFYRYLGEGTELEARLMVLRDTLFDTEVRLHPGSAIERLLAYDAIGGEIRGAKLVLRDLYVGDLPIEVPFLFTSRGQ